MRALDEINVNENETMRKNKRVHNTRIIINNNTKNVGDNNSPVRGGGRFRNNAKRRSRSHIILYTR